MEIHKQDDQQNFHFFSVRIRELYQYIADSYQEFYERTGIPKTSLNSYLKKNNPSKPGSEFFLLIKTKFPEIDLNYLFTGIGSLVLPLKLSLSRTDEPEPEYSERAGVNMMRRHQELMEAHHELIRLLQRRIEIDQKNTPSGFSPVDQG